MTTGFMPLSEVDQRAKALGLSYGQYVAQYRDHEKIRQKPKDNVYLVPLDADGNPIRMVRRSRKQLRRRADEIVQMYGEGRTIDSMAEVLGVTEVEMARFIKMSGLTREECRTGTTLGLPQDEPVYERPCTDCKVRRCDDRKMCRSYRRWFSVAWNQAVAPFRALQNEVGTP